MSKPIHLMRWAPADYVNDPAVKLALAQRDFVSSTFYPLFLFHAFIQGGTLPAEPVSLGAILGMRPADVRRALAYWTEQGKVREEEGRLSHKRVSRDLEAEKVFRSEQAALGKLSATRRLASSNPLPAGSTGRFNPPLPLPAPVPAPEPNARPANPLLAAPGERSKREREGYRLVRLISAFTGKPPEDVLGDAADYPGAQRRKMRLDTLSDDRILATVSDLRSEWEGCKAADAAKAQRIEAEEARGAA